MCRKIRRSKAKQQTLLRHIIVSEFPENLSVERSNYFGCYGLFFDWNVLDHIVLWNAAASDKLYQVRTPKHQTCNSKHQPNSWYCVVRDREWSACGGMWLPFPVSIIILVLASKITFIYLKKKTVEIENKIATESKFKQTAAPSIIYKKKKQYTFSAGERTSLYFFF